MVMCGEVQAYVWRYAESSYIWHSSCFLEILIPKVNAQIFLEREKSIKIDLQVFL